MTVQRSLRDEPASIVSGLFHAIRGVFAITRNVGPDVEYIGLGKRCESVTAHRLGERPSCQ